MPNCQTVILGKGANPTTISLLELLKARQGQPSLTQLLNRADQGCAAAQLAHCQRDAMHERKRFESVVNNCWK